MQRPHEVMEWLQAQDVPTLTSIPLRPVEKLVTTLEVAQEMVGVVDALAQDWPALHVRLEALWGLQGMIERYQGVSELAKPAYLRIIQDLVGDWRVVMLKFLRLYAGMRKDVAQEEGGLDSPLFS